MASYLTLPSSSSLRTYLPPLHPESSTYLVGEDKAAEGAGRDGAEEGRVAGEGKDAGMGGGRVLTRSSEQKNDIIRQTFW